MTFDENHNLFGMTILIVDDSQDSLLLTQRRLKSCGYEHVHCASSAMESFELLGIEGADAELSDVDLILMDITMPEIDGIQACHRIKSTPSLTDIPIIMITALNEEEYLEAAFAAGAIDYINKPLNKVEMMVRVRSALMLKGEMDYRKQANERLEVLNDRLEQEVEERTRDLNIANEQLFQSQKMEAIGQLAGGVAHDFNNMLTPIIAYLELAIGKLPPGDHMRGQLEQSHMAAERAANLVKQLLSFSRKEIIEPRVVDLNESIVNLDKMLCRLLGETIELVTLPSDDLARVLIDPGQIDQILINLAVNARDAMSAKGKIIIETAHFDVDQDYSDDHIDIPQGQYVMLSVSDNGTGMPEEVREHVFEPFFTTKGPGKGTGLGLSVCYGIVKQNGGDILVYSEPNRGTTFKILLPRVDESPPEVLANHDVHNLPRGTETVFVVEDESAVQKIVSYVLREHGYTVVEASSGFEALQMVKQGAVGNVDLLLTDVVMPGMGGKDLADQFVGLYPDTKILYTSGYTDNAIVRNGALEQGIHFMQKPLTPRLITSKVREVLDFQTN